MNSREDTERSGVGAITPPPLGLMAPHPNRVDHPANNRVAHVRVAADAHMTIMAPFADNGNLVWIMTWGNTEPFRYSVASILESFDSLLSDAVPLYEATRRLRILRQARRELRDQAAAAGDPPAPVSSA